MREPGQPIPFRVFFTAFGGWTGPPVIEWQGRVIDGRARLAAWHLSESPPRVVARSQREAGRLLVLAGHYQRAVEVLGDCVTFDESLSAWLRLETELVAPVLAAHDRWHRERRRRRNKRRTTPRRRSGVVQRMRNLLRGVQEGQALPTEEELERVLGDWA